MHVTPPALGYADLDPAQVVDTLADLGLAPDGRLLQLNSYENRVFQAFVDDGTAVVAKFYRPGRWSDAQILEEHAFAHELAAAEVPVVAPLVIAPDAQRVQGLGTPATLGVFEHGGVRHRLAVYPRAAGRAPNLEDPQTMTWLGRFLGRLHAVGAQGRFAQRRVLDVATYGDASLAALRAATTLEAGPDAAWEAACDEALEGVRAAFDRLRGTASLRLHGDCHPGNILWREEGPHIVDLDDACTGPAIQDLWMLLSGNEDQQRSALNALLSGYRMFMRFDERQLALIEPLRTLRMIHHSAWLASRWHDPAFPIAFPWFGHASYWAQQTTQLREQIAAMAEPPLMLY